MDIGCYKSAINRRPAIHTHAWFSNKHALTDAYAMTLNPKTSVPATSAQDMNKSSKKFRSQGARKELCRAGFAAAFVCISSLHWPRPDPVWSCGLCASSFWPCCMLRAADACCFSCGYCFHICSCLALENICIRARTVGVSWLDLGSGFAMATQCPLFCYHFTHHLSRARALQTRLTCAHISICSVIGASSGVCFHSNVGELSTVMRFGKICILSERNLSQRLLQISVGAITPILIVCLELSQQMRYCSRELNFYRTR